MNVDHSCSSSWRSIATLSVFGLARPTDRPASSSSDVSLSPLRDKDSINAALNFAATTYYHAAVVTNEVLPDKAELG